MVSTKAGERLREERSRCRWSVGQVARQLHIPEAYIEALEGGDLAFFPAEVYARGAYQKYANLLGLKQREDYHVFLRSLSESREQVPLSVPLPRSWQQRWLTPTTILGAGILFGVLMVAGYLSWQVRSFVALPSLVISEPMGQVMQTEEIWVKGQAEKEARVTVNEIPVILDGQAQFQIKLPLKPGINVLQIEAKGASGRASIIQKHVLVPRS